MSISGIHGQLLQVNVIACDKLKDTEWIGSQDPYVCLAYGNTRVRTSSCKYGGKNPNFREKFMFTLVEGLQQINLEVWSSHNFSSNVKIGSGKVDLQKVLSEGFDDNTWPLQTESKSHGWRYAGEVHLILHYPNAKILQKPSSSPPPPPSPYIAPPPYVAPPPCVAPPMWVKPKCGAHQNPMPQPCYQPSSSDSSNLPFSTANHTPSAYERLPHLPRTFIHRKIIRRLEHPIFIRTDIMECIQLHLTKTGYLAKEPNRERNINHHW